jgi:hypothetical protein
MVGKGNTDAIIVRYDHGGNVVWTQNFGGNGDDRYNSITSVSENSVVAVGYSGAFSSGDWGGITGKGGTDAIMVKYEIQLNAVFVPVSNITNLPATVTAGTPLTLTGTVMPSNATNRNIEWSMVNAGTTGATITNGVLNTTSAGTVNLLAKIINGTNSTTDYTQTFTITVNAAALSQGEPSWKTNFGGNGTDVYTSTTKVSDGIIAVGYSANTSFNNGDWTGYVGKGNEDAIIVKYDNNGNVVWRRHFGGNGNDRFQAVTTVSDGVIAVGYSANTSFGNGDWDGGVAGKGNDDAIIVKYDNTGNVIWKKHFGGSNVDAYTSVTAVADGIIAVGYSANASFNSGDWTGVSGNGGDEAIVVKYDNAGNIVWQNNFGGSNDERFNSITTVSDGIIAVGYSYVNGTGDWTGVTYKSNMDAIMVKFDHNGEMLWKQTFGGSYSTTTYRYNYYSSVTTVSDGIIAAGYSSTNSFGANDLVGLTCKGGNDAIIVKYDHNIITSTQGTTIQI